ncbi:hypothetical protein [Streptomyces sp. NPDC001450]
MLVDPGQAADVEAAPGAGDGHIGQAGLLVVDPAGRMLSWTSGTMSW